MRNILAVLLGILLVVGFSVAFKHNSIPAEQSPLGGATLPVVSSTPPVVSKTPTESLFVPYWAIGREQIASNSSSELIYFGITPVESGINKNEAGYKNLQTFVKASGSYKKQLVLRMVDSDMNFIILKNKNNQEKIIRETLQIALENGFSGVILDLEISSLPFESVMSQINEFVAVLHANGKKQDMPISIALYGDVFYRIRPYDVVTLAKNTDGVYIMTYDFHKVRGNPGPNFPLSGKDRFGYDLNTMMDAFLKFYPKEKITIVFGMYGYDWIIDSKSSSSQAAQAVTLNQAKNKFLSSCNYKDCVVVRDAESAEMKITYTDSANDHHEVWLEDTESVAKKKEVLKTKGITATSLWAYSYF